MTTEMTDQEFQARLEQMYRAHVEGNSYQTADEVLAIQGWKREQARAEKAKQENKRLACTFAQVRAEMEGYQNRNRNLIDERGERDHEIMNLEQENRELREALEEATSASLTTERQDEIREMFIKAIDDENAAIDGAGTDGDAWDFTLGEIQQGINHLVNRVEKLREAKSHRANYWKLRYNMIEEHMKALLGSVFCECHPMKQTYHAALAIHKRMESGEL